MEKKSRMREMIASPGRRRMLIAAGAATAGQAMLGMPLVQAKQTQRVVVRSLGGAYEEAMKKAIHQPFTETTGIEVVLQTATAGQVRAMVKAGRVGIDVVDLGLATQLLLDRDGMLAPLDYDGMKFTRPDDIYASQRRPNIVGNLYFATVLAYNTEVFPDGTHPKSWAEFWDASAFPGARTLASQLAGSVPLEFAELAAGKAIDSIYPIDLDHAFKSLAKVKPHVIKWWDTGAISAQLLDRKEAVMGGVWNGRVQDLIDKGSPLAIEWNQARRETQSFSIVKGSPNEANAQKFIDFALQPKVQAEVARYIAYGPTNREALAMVRPEDAQKLPSEPSHYKQGFDMDYDWWFDNLAEVGARWQPWILQR